MSKHVLNTRLTGAREGDRECAGSTASIKNARTRGRGVSGPSPGLRDDARLTRVRFATVLRPRRGPGAVFVRGA